MKYTYSPMSRGTMKRYVPEYTILSGPDKYGACKCHDAVTNSTVFINVEDLKPVD